MEESATAAEQQASGLHEISATVASMDTVTQQNAAMVAARTAGARNLSSETERLFEQLAFFELGQALHEAQQVAQVKMHMPMKHGTMTYQHNADEWKEFYAKRWVTDIEDTGRGMTGK